MFLLPALVFAVAATPLRQENSVSALVAKAARYAQDYEREFSAVVCEERQSQRVVKSNGKIAKHRELVSDVLLVKAADRTLLFRDVISVDGKVVRDRQQRLQKLFLATPRTALQHAKAIAEESARYNIGFSRTFSGLMLPLAVLQRNRLTGFEFAGDEKGLAFQEVRSPSLVRHRRGDDVHDMFLRGTFTVDGDSGRIHAASLTARNDNLQSDFDVRYEENAELGLLVPVAMEERYTRPENAKADRLEVSSSYSTFRKFQVTVAEQFVAPR